MRQKGDIELSAQAKAVVLNNLDGVISNILVRYFHAVFIEFGKLRETTDAYNSINADVQQERSIVSHEVRDFALQEYSSPQKARGIVLSTQKVILKRLTPGYTSGKAAARAVGLNGSHLRNLHSNTSIGGAQLSNLTMAQISFFKRTRHADIPVQQLASRVVATAVHLQPMVDPISGQPVARDVQASFVFNRQLERNNSRMMATSRPR